MHHARYSIDPDVRLHAKVPLVAFLGLMHLRVAFAGAIFGGAGRSNQGGIHHGAGLEHHALAAELLVDDLQDLRAQFVLIEQMPEEQDADSVGDAFGAADSDEFTVKAGLEKGLSAPRSDRPNYFCRQ